MSATCTLTIRLITSKRNLLKHREKHKRTNQEFYGKSLMKLQDERTTMKLNKRQRLLKKRVKLWKEYFEKLLGQLAIYTTPPLIRAIISHILPRNTNNFTMEELNKTITQIPTNKASGSDAIPGDV